MDSTQNSFSYPVHPSAAAAHLAHQNSPWMMSASGSFGGLQSPYGYPNTAFPVDNNSWGTPASAHSNNDPHNVMSMFRSPASGILSPGSPGLNSSTNGSTNAKRTNNPYAAVAVTTTSPVQHRISVFPAVQQQQHATLPTAQLQMQMQHQFQQQQQRWSAATAMAAAPFTPAGFQPPSPPPQSLPQRHGGGGPKGSHNPSGSPQGPFAPTNGIVALADVMSHVGHFEELARTANGSSFIQAAVREGSDEGNLAVIWQEIEPCFSDLLLDAHGCYVVKSIMSRLPPVEMNRLLEAIACDSLLVFSMCTHSLHTRRVVQYLLDNVDCTFIIQLLTTHCVEIATTQQGCIIMQRAMDVAQGPSRDHLFDAIYHNLITFAVDPFANYVAQHLLEVGEKERNSAAFMMAFAGRVVELSCNKFSSNVMETALFHLNAEAQHNLLVEMYSGGEDVLYKMLQDSFGNYIIQSSIALATRQDVVFINHKLGPVLQRTPYGHKIESRIDRRLKGKPVGVRNAMFGPAGQRSAAPVGPRGVDGPAHDATPNRRNNTTAQPNGHYQQPRAPFASGQGSWSSNPNNSLTTLSSEENAEEPW